MIRINLLDDIKLHTTDAIGKSISINLTPISGKQIANLIIKLGFVLLPSLAIFGWNHTEKTSKEKVLSVLKVREQEILTQIQQKHQKYNEIKELQQETLNLDRVIESLSQTAKKRTITLEALNFLHHIVPEQTWLTEVKFSQDNKIIFTGEAKPSDINIFAANIDQKKEVYKNVNILPNEDLENTKTDYTKFKISAELALDQNQEENLDNLEKDMANSGEEKAAQDENVTNQDAKTSTDQKQSL